MIACTSIFIYGILFTSVDCDFGIAPQHQEPLSKLLKKTISHVKSFLGEFERQIKDSRLIVRKIHNQSLLSNNYSTIATNDIGAINETILSNQNPVVLRDDIFSTTYDLNATETVKPENEIMLSSPAKYDLPNGNLIIAQRRATTIKSTKHLSRKALTRFKIGREIKSEQEWLKTNAFRATSGVKSSVTPSKNPKRLMRQGAARFLSKELYDSEEEKGNPIVFFKGFKIFNNSTQHPKRLMRQGPARFLSEETLNTLRIISSDIISQSNTTTKSFNITKLPKQTSGEVAMGNQSKDKVVTKPEADDKVIVFRGADEESTTKRKRKQQQTISKFYFRLKENILSEPTQEYPDIFLRGVDRKTSHTIRKTNTPQIFTTETVTEHIGGVIPELTKDYQNINFRAQSSDEGDSPISLYSHKLNRSSNRALMKHESLIKQLSHESKPVTSKNVYTTKALKDTHEKIGNVKLRQIIAPSSYSLSDEETYIKVNLLDQLLHYNKTLNESEMDKT